MPRVGFKPTIPASNRAKTVLVLNHSATVTGDLNLRVYKLKSPPSRYNYDLAAKNLIYFSSLKEQFEGGGGKSVWMID
jgi:hypothetical protein